jgi:hypothetical protein
MKKSTIAVILVLTIPIAIGIAVNKYDRYRIKQALTRKQE